TVVPQTMWPPYTITDRKQHVTNAVLQMPIFFEGIIDGRLGLPLEAAAAGRCHSLRNAQGFAPLGHRSTTHIRIWPGYKDFKRQVQIRDQTSEHNPITISRFAHHIGRSVDAFLKVSQRWQIGLSGILRSNIIVIGAVHVSTGSWMPILQLNRYIP
ncbi:hypothetical protein EDB84DRAFT_1273527, partial [Lactarius hengduanensis]